MANLPTWSKKIKENSGLFFSLPIIAAALASFYLFYLKRAQDAVLFGAEVPAPGSPASLIYLYDISLLALSVFFAAGCLKLILINNRQRNEERGLQEKLDNKSTVLSIASHELSAPLSNIKGTLYTVLPQLKDDYKTFVQGAIVSTEELIKLIEDILTVSRFELGKIKLTLEPSDLEKLCQEVVNQFSGLASESKVELKYQKSQSKLDNFVFDPTRIRQVVVNFVSNAIKYAAPGTVMVSAAQHGPEAVVTVSDTGQGIKPEELPHLFHRFSRADSNAAGHHGTGLGLYISRLIVEAHRGKISVESTIGKGSTFSFTLPRK